MSSTFLALFAFISIMAIYLIVMTILNKRKSYAEKLLDSKFDDDTQEENNSEEEKESSITSDKKGFLSKLELDLKEAQIKMDYRIFLAIFVGISVVLYIGAFYVFGQPLVSFAPLPFSLYFIPKIYLEFKKGKEMDIFEGELVQILRRMSSTLKNGSILQALEDIKDLTSLSFKSRNMLNEIYHRYKFGDSIETAFSLVAEDSGSKQFKICAISIDINKELGSDLSESLNDVALTIQRLSMSEKESKSLTVQTLMIGRILSIVPFFIIGFIMISNKSYFNNYLGTIGHQLMFLLLFSMMFFGIYFIEKTAKSK